MKTGIELIAGERLRQIHMEGYDAANDDQFTEQELAKAAAAYALPDVEKCLILKGPIYGTHGTALANLLWPFEGMMKNGPRLNELIKAGALIAAEIDRLLRAASK